MSSRLYRTLAPVGLPSAGLVQVTIGDDTDHLYDDRLGRVEIRAGGDSLEGHQPADVTVEAKGRISYGDPGTLTGGRQLRVRFPQDTASWLAGRTYSSPSLIRDRFRGRVGAQEADDRGDHRGGWYSTRLTGAAWSSLFANHPETFTPTAGRSITGAMAALWDKPSYVDGWPGYARYGRPWEEWPSWPETVDPITASDLMGIFTDRLYVVSDMRDGRTAVRDLYYYLDNADAVASSSFPLGRAHVLAPTVMALPSTHPTEYEVTVLEDGVENVYVTAPGGDPTGTTRLEKVDWTDLQSNNDHWRRIQGKRWETFQANWRLPNLTVRLDKLVASDNESDRRAAGALLSLHPGVMLPLPGDWRHGLAGLNVVTGITESFTPDGWTMTLALVDYQAISNDQSPPTVPARTWDQATATWGEQTATWNDGAVT